MYDYRTPGNEGLGTLYTNDRVFGIQLGNNASAKAKDGSVSGISIGDSSKSRALGVALGHYSWSNLCTGTVIFRERKNFSQRIWNKVRGRQEREVDKYV